MGSTKDRHLEAWRKEGALVQKALDLKNEERYEESLEAIPKPIFW